MKKSNLLDEHQNKNIKVGKRIKFTLDLKKDNSKQSDNHILNPIAREKSEKGKENVAVNGEENKIKMENENKNEKNSFEDKDYLAEFNEKEKLEKKEEKKENGNNDDLKIYDDEEEDEYFNQPLMKVHRMSMKKKELGRIINNLKKLNVKKPESISNVTIDRNKAQQMAQNIFKRRLTYFNKIRTNSESNDKNISDYVSSKPKRHFKNILSDNSDINNNFSQEKNNTKRININTNIYKLEDENDNENEKYNINLNKKFRRLPTDIYKNNNYDTYLTQDNSEKKQEKKEKEKRKNNDLIMIKEKEEIKEIPKKEIKVIPKKEIKVIPKKEIKEVPKKEKKEEPRPIKEQKKEIKELKQEIPIPINKREYRRKYILSNLDNTNIVNRRNNKNNWSYSFNEESNRTASSLINTTQQNLKPKNIGGIRIRLMPFDNLQKELNQENEKNEVNEVKERENLSSFRYRRKYKEKENKTEEGEPKLVYKAVIRVNKRIKPNNESTKKEPIENKYQKFKEIKTDNKYNTEQNLRNRYGKKMNINDDEVNKKIEKEKIKENNDNNNKTVSTAFYRRRVFKKI